jgi:hypothetical protein
VVNVTARVILTKRKILFQVNCVTDKGQGGVRGIMINKRKGTFHQVLISVLISYRE